jgi:serine/threonine-protein kinase
MFEMAAALDTTLARRFRLEEVIGRGGMSTVYRATDQILARTVAVKVLLPVLADQDPAYSARFEREARAAAALASSGVVTVYDTGVDDGSHYIVMEYVAGRSLDEMLRAGTPLPLPEALRIAARVADSLAAAHAAGILHRDIKPANVMVAEDRTVKVLDFGIARRLDGTTITQAASVVGTAAYMAPERAMGDPGDARADIYSLGCLLYAMLTGHPPFSGEISAAILQQQINAKPRPPSESRPEVPTPINTLVLAMLAKTPDARPATAAEVRDQIMRASSGLRTAAAPPATARLADGKAPTAVLGGRPRSPWLAEHRRRAILMALATGVVAVIALGLLGGGGGSSRHAAGSSTAHTTTVPPAVHTTATTPKPKSKAKSPKPRHSEAGPSPPGGLPPGHGGTPPGQAKKGGD